MKKHVYSTLLNTNIEEAWGFFTSPMNLAKITPKEMNFEIKTIDDPETIYPGMVITYCVSPFPLYRTGWITEITHIKVNKYFIDDQRVGPYKFWQHQHHFEQVNECIMMTDVIHYSIGYGWLGLLIEKYFVKSQVDKIFKYREQQIKKIFGSR